LRAELGEPSFAPARWFVKYCVPWIGALLSGGARAEYEHLEKSVLNFHAADFTELIEQAGLSLVKVDFMNFGSVGLYVAAAPSEVKPPPPPHAERNDRVAGLVCGGSPLSNLIYST